MTDVTAAQPDDYDEMSEWELRDVARQQAQQITALKERNLAHNLARKNLVKTLHRAQKTANEDLATAESEVTALRKVIEAAIAAHKAGPSGFDNAHIGALAVYDILATALLPKASGANVGRSWEPGSHG